MFLISKAFGSIRFYFKCSSQIFRNRCHMTRPLSPWKPQKWFVLLCILLLLLLLLKPVAIKDKTVHHLAIISATHFRGDDRGVEIFRLIQSPLEPVENHKYGKMVLLFGADSKFRKKYKRLMCLSFNGTHEVQSTARVTLTSPPLPFCKWTLYIAVCNVIQQPYQFMLATYQWGGTRVVVPYREPVRKQYDVVACFSPLFLNEHWQVLLTSLEIRRAHGLSLQVVYVQSMRAQLMQILRIYERRKIVALEKWSNIDIGESKGDLGYDPNYELVWRNQEGAHTDCFLKYKVSTKYIMVSDIDDILLPKIAPTYIEEFQFLLNKQNPAGILYPRQDVDVFTSSSPGNFSIYSLLHNAILTSTPATGKHVALTESVISVNLHWPGLSNRNGLLEINFNVNFIYHLRNWFYDIPPRKYKDPTIHRSVDLSGSGDLFPLHSLINDAQLLEYQKNFEKFMNKTFRELFDNLYSEQLYYPLVDACYNVMFYEKYRSHKAIYHCPGPIRCRIPVMPGVRCVNARIDYKHFNMTSDLRLHFPTHAVFVESNDGCKM